MEDLQELNKQLESAKNLANNNKTDAKDLLGEKAILSEETVEKFMDGYAVPKNNILVISDWDLPQEEMFPLVHVAKLGNLDIYTREMSVKDMSDYINCLLTYEPNIKTQEVKLNLYNMKFTPWENIGYYTNKDGTKKLIAPYW